MRRRCWVVVLVAALVVAMAAVPSSYGETHAVAKTQLQKLQGKQLPGRSGKWLAIASPFKHPIDVAGTITPPVETTNLVNTVSFFEFPSTSAAHSFYRNPPIAARMDDYGVLQYRPLAGSTGVPAPSRGLDLRTCLWPGGPGEGGTAGKGKASGGVLNSAGKCTKGTLSSFGVAIFVQRGKFVVISEAIGHFVISGMEPASALTGSLGASKYANSALALMQKVGIKLS